MENERENIEKLKQNAEAELREMQRRATIPPMPPFVKVNSQNVAEAPHHETEKSEDAKNGGHDLKPQGNKKSLFGKDILKFLNLENFELDSDRMLLLLMIFLLSRENNDEILLFALAYIML